MANTLRQSSYRSHALTVSVGKRLRDARLQQGLTQADLEKATGLKRSHISRIENGWRMPSLETLSRLAGALNIPLVALLQNAATSPDHPAGQTLEGRDAFTPRIREEDPFMEELKTAFLRLSEADQRVILATARKMARRAPGRSKDQEGE